MNLVFFFLIAIAYGTTVLQQFRWSSAGSIGLAPMHTLTEQLFQAANDSVTLSIGLIGVLCLFLGLLQIAEKGGLLQSLAKLIYPLVKRLFPDIPPNHPALGAMVMNLSANMVGVGNAATPFGLKAMKELDKLNTNPGVATNAMVLFLAINTSSVTLLPTKVLALRASAGSTDPASIIATTLIATIISTIVAIIAAKALQKLNAPPAPVRMIEQQELTPTVDHAPAWMSYLLLVGIVALIPLTLLFGKQFSPWIIPTFIVGILSYGLYKKVDIYSTFTEGAKEGVETAFRIIPFLVAILVAIAMFRASGAMDAFTNTVGAYTAKWGLPAEAIPMAIMRPLSGSGSLGILSDIFNNPAIGPDSYTGTLVSTMMGCTETTFYVLAVYFGAVQIRRIRHALWVGLIADVAGIIASVFAVRMLLFPG